MTTRLVFAIAAAASVLAAAPATGDAAVQLSEDGASGVKAPGVNAFEAGERDVAIDSRFEFEHVSCRGEEGEIRVIVTGVKRSEGLIIADMYPNDQAVFLRGRGRIKKVRYAARAPISNSSGAT